MKSFSLLLSFIGLISGCGSQLSQNQQAALLAAMQPAAVRPAVAATAAPQQPVITPSSRPPRREAGPDEPETAPAEPAPTTTPYRASGKPLQIKLFRSYASDGTVHVRGRVMEPEPQPPVNADDSTLTNFLRNLDNMTVEEKAGIKVDLNLEGKTVRLVSDHEGMLLVSTTLFGKVSPGLHDLHAQVVPGQGYWSPRAETRLIVHPQAEESLGFVSDIDDTIKVSEVVDKLTAAKRLFFSNEKTAEPIPGTAALYKLLEQRDGKADGDIHYLSGSPLNLAEAIYGFLDGNGYPRGSVDLKKWGFDKGDDNPIAQKDYKQGKLRTLLQTYPKRSFICFGDSGEHDPEIYREISKEFPGRIKAIFINNVTKAKPTDARFAGEYLTNSAAEAAQILQKSGLLAAADVEKVKAAL